MYLLTLSLVLVLIEFVSFAALHAKREIEKNSRDYAANLNAYYKDKPYQDYLSDYLASVAQVYAVENLQYDPYRGYKPWGDFRSISINTDSEDFRSTTNPPNVKSLPTKHVAMFGGSTQWGIGTIRDADTISSLFSKLVNSTPKNTFYYEVKNYGVWGLWIFSRVFNIYRKAWIRTD